MVVENLKSAVVTAKETYNESQPALRDYGGNVRQFNDSFVVSTGALNTSTYRAIRLPSNARIVYGTIRGVGSLDLPDVDVGAIHATNSAILDDDSFATALDVDDTGKHVPKLLENGEYTHASIKSYWPNCIDGFFSQNNDNCFICLHGEIRIVIAYQNEDEEYNFKQYFLSGMDGKCIFLDKNIWFAIQNINNGPSILIRTTHNYTTDKTKYLNHNIFDWHSKRI